MTAITKPKINGGLHARTMVPFIVLGLGGIVFMSNFSPQPYVNTSSNTLHEVLALKSDNSDGASSPFEEKNYDKQARMEEWRNKTKMACQKMLEDAGGNFGRQALAQKEQLERDAVSKIKLPHPASVVTGSLPPGHQAYEYCRNVFIDLGTNIGDSIGHFVDNALDVCSPMWKNATKGKRNNRNNQKMLLPRPHLDVTDLIISHGGKKDNPLFKMLQSGVGRVSNKVSSSPDSFCVYGMEGNPEFTERLQKLENYIIHMQPRPVRHLHIHTESVVTAVDGPTKLYLDKTSVKENFWGSSILSSQQDAQKSAKLLGNGTVFSADVDGITLSTLVQNTALPFKPGASPDEEKGGTLIIKMDVEGAEYQVLKEVAKSGVLCEYINKGNRVVMIVEFHNMSITNAAERRREKAGHGEAKEKLRDCGVEFRNLQAIWH